MKRTIAALATGLVIAAGAGIGATVAAAAGSPEIDAANATIQLPKTTFAITRCAGEDGEFYETLRGHWTGGETDVTPGSTDYNLTGKLAVNNVVWTINLKTQRGVLHGNAVLTSIPATTAVPQKTYAGPITLITQGDPTGAANGTTAARGWINAPTFTNKVADGGSLLANVEMQILPSFSANGEFGGSMGFPDFSVATNNQTC
jgi:hypothetical protein